MVEGSLLGFGGGVLSSSRGGARRGGWLEGLSRMGKTIRLVYLSWRFLAKSITLEE